jgi:hypothetical protein
MPSLFRKFRHGLPERYENAGRFSAGGDGVDERTQAAWNVLARMRQQGALLNEAEEYGLPHILLPDEKSEEQTEERPPPLLRISLEVRGSPRREGCAALPRCVYSL